MDVWTGFTSVSGVGGWGGASLLFAGEAMEIVGAGRIGSALALLWPGSNVVRRNEGTLVSAPSGPILVTVRNDDLDAVLETVPASRRSDLVFVQNGMIRPWLQQRGLEQNTRGLLYFAVAKKGDLPTPGAPSPFCGPHAVAVVHALNLVGLPAQAVGPGEFLQAEMEKLIWNCAFGLLCEATHLTVGELVGQRREEVSSLIEEFGRTAEAVLGVRLEAGLVDRCCAYSLEIASYRGAIKEWPWRNGWFVEQSRARGLGEPEHRRWLKAVGKS